MRDEKLMTDLKCVALTCPVLHLRFSGFPDLLKSFYQNNLSSKKGTVRVDLLEKDETVHLKESNLKQLKESIYVLIGW